MTEHHPFLKELYQKLSNNDIEANDLILLAEVVVENSRLDIIQEIFSYDENNEYKVRENKNIYKWGFMYGDNELQQLLEKEMLYKCIQGAINAAISHDNYQGFKHLLKHYPQEVLTEKNFNIALTWNNQSRYSFNIMNEYINHLDRISDLSQYSIEQIKGFKEYSRAPNLHNNLETVLLKKKIEQQLKPVNTEKTNNAKPIQRKKI